MSNNTTSNNQVSQANQMQNNTTSKKMENANKTDTNSIKISPNSTETVDSINQVEKPQSIISSQKYFKKGFYYPYRWIVESISLNIEVFLRANLGERYFSLPKIIFGFASIFFLMDFIVKPVLEFFMFFNTAFSVLNSLDGFSDDPFSSANSLMSAGSSTQLDTDLIPYILWVIFLAYIYRFFTSFSQNKEGDYTHSDFMGDSVLSFISNIGFLKNFFKGSLVADNFAQIVVEPLLVISLGLLLFFATMFKSLGILLVVLGVFFAIKMILIYYSYKDKVLDEKNKKIEGEF